MDCGVNCGFGNGDCASLPLSAVNLDAGWIDFPRPKTGINRRCPLWPETVAYAQKIATGPAFAAGMIKLAAVQGAQLPMDGALLLERELLNRVFASADAMEGMSAFLEKRRPHYK